MRINAEQVHQLEGGKDIRRRKQSLGNQLWVKVVPLLPRYIGHLRISRDFRCLLNVGKGAAAFVVNSLLAV